MGGGAGAGKFAKSSSFAFFSRGGGKKKKIAQIPVFPELAAVNLMVGTGPFLVAFTHNALREELRDMIRVVNGMCGRADSLLNWEVPNFFGWFKTLSLCIRQLFAVEELALYPALEAINGTPVLAQRKNAKLDIANRVIAVEEIQRLRDISDVEKLTRISLACSAFAVKLFSYWEMKEAALPTIIKTKCSYKQLQEMHLAFMEDLLGLDDGSQCVALCARGVPPSSLGQWLESFLGKKTSQYESWRRDFEKNHMKKTEDSIYAPRAET
mmetsp:Transcript_20880/g.55775  ORF Transcript_20880/g.55775 Transcript_20880/m.55775 type:complete len:268 (+) Transcript_20880:3-806(+)